MFKSLIYESKKFKLKYKEWMILCVNCNYVNKTVNTSDEITKNKRCPELFPVCSLSIHGLLLDPVAQCPGPIGE